MTRALARRLNALLGVLVVVAWSTVSPASAHSASNTPASNYVSRVLTITPAAAPFRAKVIEAGNRLQIQWRSGPELTIADYDGFPYLRVGPEGVFENRQSAATYINADRQSRTRIPAVKPDGPPEWKKVSSGPQVRFHYHPIHYMGSVPPPQVQRAKGEVHNVQDWTLDVVQSSRTFTIAGDLRWVPGPSPVLPLAATLVVGISFVTIVVVLARRRHLDRAIPLMVTGLVALVIVDFVHLFGIAFSVHGGSGFTRAFTIGWISMGAWVLALASVYALIRKRYDALYVSVFAAGIITLVGGLSDITVLSASAVPFAFPIFVARVSIALTLGLGIGVVVAGVVLTGAIAPDTANAVEDGDADTHAAADV